MKTPLVDPNTSPPTLPAAEATALPSGRSVTLRTGPDREEIEIRSPSGEVEVRITLTEQGPVVRLRAARLELVAADEVRVDCARFAVRAGEAVELKTAGDLCLEADGDLRARSGQDTHIDGKMIYLNCQ